jgi:1-acyl-sn-glycerol-3-phosphate acyltransferase
MNRIFFTGLINIILSLVCDIHILGSINIPSKEGCIIVSNHLGRLDVLLVYQLIKREDIIMGIAEKYKRYAFFRLAAKSLNAIWIDRYNVDFKALRRILRELRDGGILVLAPEGTRSPTQSLVEGKHGAAYLAYKTGLQIIPVAITGTEDDLVVRNMKRLKKSGVIVRIGNKFVLPKDSYGKQSASLKKYTEEIMCQIAALLPPEYRGVYSDHPRLRELITNT